ncbi:MAG TPA: DUF6010 family protein [Ferruginibacter sp.]|nr:hypothetical protein [Chitinophagaceae bacterium]HRI25184.1 DUF6010 family protein [Ferruginibacter sp.]
MFSAIIIGFTGGLLNILFFTILKRMDKGPLYALILSGIGFLYVGFVWTDMQALIINSAQAILFVFIAYYGIRKSTYILATGYFLHGIWDITYQFFQNPGLIPPHYEWFCMTIDFVIGIYIWVFIKQFSQKEARPESIKSNRSTNKPLP